jgi:uncharacterized membrane protein
MEKVMIVVFDTEEKAYQGRRALMQLDAEGSINIHASAVIAKNQDGTVALRQTDDQAPMGILSGGLLGSLIGVLGGPAGLVTGAFTGSFLGGVMDVLDSGISADFIEDVSNALLPGKVAVAAEVYEEWVTPVDTQMEQLGGVVFRPTWMEFLNIRDARAVAADRAEVAQLKAERAQAGADRKAKLQARIDERTAKLEKALKRIKERVDIAKQERDAKVKALQDKAAAAKQDMKDKYHERIARIRAAYDERVKQLQKAAA